MISNHEEDEFVAVRVQDPRVQNEGSWNSFVDFKIFLHTNSKAFTAKTSCVRRRYSEFVWLRKKMQKNAGLVPVPDLPGKSFFSFSNEDFLEKRRRGLQAFLEKVVHTTVCLSDSQLHLFLQTQLPIGHILDCVQGHTPYSVTDAILTYASSNRGLAQAQEDDAVKDSSLTVSYESMESPAPHPPCPPCGDADADPLDDLVEVELQDSDESQAGGSVRICQRSHHLEAVVEEERRPPQASFYLGGSPSPTPAVVHLDAAAQEEEEETHVNSEPAESETLLELLGFKEKNDEEQGTGHGVPETRTTTSEDAGSQTKEETQQVDVDRSLCANGLQEGRRDLEDDSQSVTSDGSIVTVSEEEEEEEEEGSACEEAEASEKKTPPPGVDILDLQVDGRSAVAGDGELNENSDISILEICGAPGLAEGKCGEEPTADKTQEVKV